MFLFESRSKRILYTGDFRLEDASVLRNIAALHDVDGNVIRLDAIHLDTTFFAEKTMYLPKRAESADAVVETAKKWFAGGRNRLVRLQLPAGFGHEQIFKAFWLDFKENGLVHVSEKKFAQYETIEDIAKLVTMDPTNAKFHVDNCGCSLPPERVKNIRPSAMRFTMRPTETSIVEDSRNLTRVCYSTHASGEEIRDFVEYLKPKKLYPNVVPKGEDPKHIHQMLQKMMENTGKSDNSSSESESAKSIWWSSDFSDESSLPEASDEASREEINFPDSLWRKITGKSRNEFYTENTSQNACTSCMNDENETHVMGSSENERNRKRSRDNVLTEKPLSQEQNIVLPSCIIGESSGSKLSIARPSSLFRKQIVITSIDPSGEGRGFATATASRINDQQSLPSTTPAETIEDSPEEVKPAAIEHFRISPSTSFKKESFDRLSSFATSDKTCEVIDISKDREGEAIPASLPSVEPQCSSYRRTWRNPNRMSHVIDEMLGP